MTPIIVTILVLTIVFSFLPFGQRLIEKITFGLLKAMALPWIGLGATFLWTFTIFPNPTMRGYIFGAFVTAIAAVLTFWAPRNENVKSMVKSMFFGGRDIWSQSNFNFYSGLLWGAGVALLLPHGGPFLNFAGLFMAIVWIVWQSYKGHEEEKMAEDDTAASEAAGA